MLAALHRKGFAVPEPYLYDDTQRVTAPYLVIEWVDGSTERAADDLPAGAGPDGPVPGRSALPRPASLQLAELEPIEDPCVAVIPYLPSTEAGRQVSAALASGAFDTGPRPPRPAPRRLLARERHLAGRAARGRHRLGGCVPRRSAGRPRHRTRRVAVPVRRRCDGAVHRPATSRRTRTPSDRCGSTRCRSGSCTSRQLRSPPWVTGAWSRPRKLAPTTHRALLRRAARRLG